MVLGGYSRAVDHAILIPTVHISSLQSSLLMDSGLCFLPLTYDLKTFLEKGAASSGQVPKELR